LFDLKGHDDLLDAAPELCRRFEKLIFMWVGDGSLRPAFEKRIAAMKLQDRFILVGLVPPARIPELVNAMDIVAHPSRREGLARALPQGSLAGKPVVTYDIDGAKEGVLNGQTGFVVPAFDRGQFTAKITELLEDGPLRQTMGQSGKQFAADRFDSKVMVTELEKVYRSIRNS
jgi:glycosyltransferase involved in cell wall biosynthesis